MKRLLPAFVILLMATGCTIIQTEEMTLEEGAKEECRRIEVSGSLIGDMVCHNRATWAAIEEKEREQAQQELGEFRDRGGQYYNPEGFGN